MMKAILGPALGGLAAGALALVASAAGRPAAPADSRLTPAADAARPIAVADSQTEYSSSTTAPTTVRCEPQQEAVLRRTIVAGREATEVACVSQVPNSLSAAAAYVDPAVDDRTPARAQTASAQPARQIVYRDRPVTSTRQVETKKRSWKKTALVIGGSTAAGAGVGGLAGGKKGALIGAAIGGGAATIYEAIKR
jgi:uncharacterized protein YcfJ